jgi:hypothetical protein
VDQNPDSSLKNVSLPKIAGSRANGLHPGFRHPELGHLRVYIEHSVQHGGTLANSFSTLGTSDKKAGGRSFLFLSPEFIKPRKSIPHLHQ